MVVMIACSDPDDTRIRQTTPSYDKQTGRLAEIPYDRNRNGRIDTWAQMDGARLVAARSDVDEDGTLDRWEYYDDRGGLTKFGFSRKQEGRADAWAFPGEDGAIERVEVSSTADERTIDSWEFYKAGVLTRVDDDTNGDSRPDNFYTYESGAVKTAAIDQDGDGRPDRQLTYADGSLILIESEPDASGTFRKSVQVQQYRVGVRRNRQHQGSRQH
jgi:hypothetical protein